MSKPILISSVRVGRRFKEALDIQKGAANARAIAQVLVNAIDECRDESVPEYEDCAVFLILHQLAYVLTGITDLSNYGKWDGAMDACHEKVKS